MIAEPNFVIARDESAIDYCNAVMDHSRVGHEGTNELLHSFGTIISLTSLMTPGIIALYIQRVFTDEMNKLHPHPIYTQPPSV